MLDTLWDHATKSDLPDDFGLALAAAGWTAGDEFGEALAKLASNDSRSPEEIDDDDRKKKLVELWCTFDSQVGWGRLEAQFPSPDDRLQSDEGVLLVWHNAFAEGRRLPQNENDLCAFMSGYIGGVLGQLLGHEVEVTHGEDEPCIRRGTDHCAFRFKPRQ
jgi:predicted hydrocarbon binding protein